MKPDYPFYLHLKNINGKFNILNLLIEERIYYYNDLDIFVRKQNSFMMTPRSEILVCKYPQPNPELPVTG